MEFENFKEIQKMFKNSYNIIVTRSNLERGLKNEFLVTDAGDFDFYYDSYNKKYILEFL